jgi:hypothetical protein
MIHREKLFFILFFGIIIFTTKISAQDDITGVILSPKVGHTINLYERNNYNLFQQYDNFDSAAVFVLNNKMYFVQFFLRDINGVDTNLSVWYSERLIKILSEKIDHFDELKYGDYRIGDSEAKLSFMIPDLTTHLPASQTSYIVEPISVNQKQSLQSSWSNELPFSKNNYTEENPERWMALGISLTAISHDFSGVNQAFTAIENKYRAQGYTIAFHETKIDFSSWIGAYLQLRLYNNFHAVIETGNQLSTENKYYGNEKYYMASASILYEYHPSEIKWIRTYISLGAGKYHFEINRNYGSSNRISETSPTNQSYYYLDKLSSSGGSVGFPLAFGIDIVPDQLFGFGVYGKYLFAPKINIESGDGLKYSVNLSGFHLGGRFSIYF